jgi:Putative bacterial sensory transduction regulator
MSDLAAVQQRTHRLLEQILNDSLNPPDDGHWSLSYGTVPLVVSILEREGYDGAVVLVASPILTDVAKTPELLDVLNTMNASMYFAHAYWSDGYVFVAANLVGETLDLPELHRAMSVVGDWSDKLDEPFAQRFKPE